MTPFTVTIKITEATQCHHVVSQLLRVFPTLSLTIVAQDETIPTPARPPQTDDLDEYIRARVADCVASLYPRRDPAEFRRAIDRAFRDALDKSYRLTAGSLDRPFNAADFLGEQEFISGVGADSDASTTRDEASLVAARCATPADGKGYPSYPWKTDDFNDAVADARIEADADAARAAYQDDVHGRNNHPDGPAADAV